MAHLKALKDLYAGSQEQKWKLRPKHRLFQHLVENTAVVHGSPGTYWTFLDESIGGLLSRMALRRGGVDNSSLLVSRLLTRVAVLALNRP